MDYLNYMSPFFFLDFDNDGTLGPSDIETVIRYITGQHELTIIKEEELKMIVDKVGKKLRRHFVEEGRRQQQHYERFLFLFFMNYHSRFLQKLI